MTGARLDDELRRLVSAGVIRPYQADALRAAAEADAACPVVPLPLWLQPTTRGQAAGERPTGGPAGRRVDEECAPAAGRKRPSALVEILGYLGGALMLGALALLTLANWGEMGRPARIVTGGSAAFLLLGAAVLLAVFRGRDQVSSALAALGCCVAGFATYVAVEGPPGRLAGVAVALVLAVAGVWVLAGSSLLVATFGILSAGVVVLATALAGADGSRSATAGLAGIGFLGVALVLAMLGLVRDEVMSWSLAGAAVFGSSMCWLIQDRGEVMALAVGTAGSVALLFAHARRQASAYVVVGCAMLLVVWPTALYQSTDDLAGVAVGVGVASAVLLLAVALLGRHRRGSAG